MGMGDLTADAVPGIPTGTVTFFFSDIEGSTRLWEAHPEHMRAALRRHDAILRASIESNDGYVFSLAGDQFVAAFHHVPNALAAASAAQLAIQQEEWSDLTPIAVRIGIHVGVAEERDNDYFGQVLNRTARIVSAAHGGQTLLSAAAAPLARDVVLTDLGEHRLKDLAEAERIWQLGTDTFPALRTLAAARHNLPVERTPLVGRTDEVIEIAKTVLEHRLVSLLGIGGTGKTRLALAVAAEVADRFEGGTWFVDLVPATDANSVAEAAASASGLRLTGSYLVEALAEQVAQRQMLLVFDNCEHLTDDVADVIDHLLERSSNVHIIVTSREPLELQDEHQIRVQPLAVASSSGSPAIRLFVEAANRVGADLGADHTEQVANICRHLDGLPLSIELAAAQLRQLTLTQLEDRLDQRFQLLSRGGRRRRGRHSSLIDVLSDSWAMLDEAEQSLLKLAAAFPSSFTLADLEEASKEMSVVHSLGGIVDRGLVANDGHGGLKLLETVKLFVRDRWADDPTSPDFEDQHTEWILNHARTEGADNAGLSIALAGWSMLHYDDHRAVEDRLAAAARFDELAELLWYLRWPYSRELPQRASQLIERLERYIAETGLTDTQSATLHVVAGRAARAARSIRWYRTGAETAIGLLRPLGPSPELVSALIGATFDRIVNDPETAYELLDEAYHVALDIGDETLAAATLGYRANYLALAHRFPETRLVLEELASRPNAGRADQVRVMALEATMQVDLLDDPSRSRAAVEELVEITTDHGLDHDWFMELHRSSGVAATGDIEGTIACIDRITVLLEESRMDGLPDILLPYLTLANALGEKELCRRWLTAIRQGEGVLGTGISIGVYRVHRSVVGLVDYNPLDDTTIEEILVEAQTWLQRGSSLRSS